MRRILPVIVGMLLVIVCGALIINALGSFVENQSALLKERTQIPTP
jgi:uncharacterized integral membrane protein